MKRTVRIGVVSTSWWANAMLLPVLKSDPQAAIVVVYGRDKNRADEVVNTLT